MKSGNKILFLTAMYSLGIFIAQRNSKAKLQRIIKDPSIGQYKNRLIEFFDIDNIDAVQQEFISLIDFGMTPSSAFSCLIESEK